MRPEDIVVDGSTPEGTKALRNYLEYARTRALPRLDQSAAEPESEFERAVLRMLQSRGYEVTPQLSVAGYRIDLAVKHPDALSTYLAAIECDGASYHSAKSVRDRDRIRQDILESMGWKDRIWRIWSTDWFRAPREESQKLLDFLEGLRTSWKPDHTLGGGWIEEGLPTTPVGLAQNDSGQDQIVVDRALLNVDNDEVRVGDFVRYVEITKPDEIISVTIESRPTDLSNGIISSSTPLAQMLLGCVPGDEVALRIPGGNPRTFRIVDVKKPSATVPLAS